MRRRGASRDARARARCMPRRSRQPSRPNIRSNRIAGRRPGRTKSAAFAVPTVDQEAARDLVRAREDCRGDPMRARYRLSQTAAPPWQRLLRRRGLDRGARRLAARRRTAAVDHASDPVDLGDWHGADGFPPAHSKKVANLLSGVGGEGCGGSQRDLR